MAEASEEGLGSKGAVVPMMMMIIKLRGLNVYNKNITCHVKEYKNVNSVECL